MCCRSLDKLEVTESGKFASKVLKGLVRLIDDEDVEEDVESLHVDVGFGVNRIRETGELNHSLKFRDKVVLRRFDRSSRFCEIQLVLPEQTE